MRQICGGLGTLVGVLIFDYWGSYDGAFILMLALSIGATALSPCCTEAAEHRLWPGAESSTAYRARG